MIFYSTKNSIVSSAIELPSPFALRHETLGNMKGGASVTATSRIVKRKVNVQDTLRSSVAISQLVLIILIFTSLPLPSDPTPPQWENVANIYQNH